MIYVMHFQYELRFCHNCLLYVKSNLEQNDDKKLNKLYSFTSMQLQVHQLNFMSLYVVVINYENYQKDKKQIM